MASLLDTQYFEKRALSDRLIMNAIRLFRKGGQSARAQRMLGDLTARQIGREFAQGRGFSNIMRSHGGGHLPAAASKVKNITQVASGRQQMNGDTMSFLMNHPEVQKMQSLLQKTTSDGHPAIMQGLLHSFAENGRAYSANLGDAFRHGVLQARNAGTGTATRMFSNMRKTFTPSAANGLDRLV